MITEEQFAAIKRLIVSENCMIDRFEHYVSEIKEPQLKEDMQKLTAALKNQRSWLLIASLQFVQPLLLYLHFLQINELTMFQS